MFSCKCISSLTVGHINFKLCRYISVMMWRVLGSILCNLDPKVKVKGKEPRICDGAPSTAALVFIHYNNYFEVHLDFGKKTVKFLSN